MCPDKQLLSAYCDDEVPSPWKERLASHLEECEACRKTEGLYRSLGRALREVPSPAFDLEAASARLAARLARRKRGRLPLWKKRVSLPFTAAAAAALLIFGSGVGLCLAFRGGGEDAGGAAVSSRENLAAIKDMNELLEVLDRRGRAGEVFIKLPETGDFELKGNPVFLREAEFSGGGRR
ncbi:MAG: zf-HC2 domain-containing protein [Spirochaetales bacterium]|jgi:hypothetical protein|nr:zf-HC2 domain-containing protein [Spirochaetales bacterium]